MTDLERALMALARDVDLPVAPQLAGRVRARLEFGPAAARSRRRWMPRVAVAAVAFVGLVVATLTFSPTVRHAVADFLGIGAVRIEVDEEGAPSAGIADELDLGEPSTVARALSVAGGAIVVPVTLGPPDEVYVEELYPQSVSLVYRAGGTLPRAEEIGVGLVATVFLETSYEVGALEKGAFLGNDVEPVEVGDFPGYWVEGTHEIVLLDAEGSAVTESARLAANALLWSDGRNTYRIESALSKAGALRVARTLLP